MAPLLHGKGKEANLLYNKVKGWPYGHDKGRALPNGRLALRWQPFRTTCWLYDQGRGKTWQGKAIYVNARVMRGKAYDEAHDKERQHRSQGV